MEHPYCSCMLQPPRSTGGLATPAAAATLTAAIPMENPYCSCKSGRYTLQPPPSTGRSCVPPRRAPIRIRETPNQRNADGVPFPPTHPALSCNADSPRPPPARYMLLLEDLAPAVSGDQARAITAYSCDPYGESLLQL